MTYYVVVAYRPEHSWAAPLGDSPLVLSEVSEAEAKKVMAGMTEYTGSAPTRK